MAGTLKSAVKWSAGSTVVRLVCGFISIKVTAVYVGPAGLALIAQLSNFYSLLQTTASNALDSAVVKMTAEAEQTQPERASGVIGTALRLVLGIGLFLAAAVFAFRRHLADWLLGGERFAPLLILAAIVLPIGMMGQLFTALFQARRRFELVSGVGIVVTVAGAAVFVISAWLFGLWGALIATVAVIPLTFLVASWLGHRDPTTRLLTFWPTARFRYVRPILGFYPMLLVHSAALPLALVVVRSLLIGNFGETQAGLWQATVRLSDMYTMIFLTVLSMYSLPTLAAARSENEFASVLRRLVALCIAAMVPTVAVLLAARDLIISIVFTSEFSTVKDLWVWRLVGDVFFIAGWPMRSALMARGRQYTYMAIEFIIGAGTLVLTWALLESRGIASANIAHALVWGGVFVCLVAVHRDVFLGRRSGEEPDR
jgi:PST family polysaccharide transporter